MKTKTKLNKHRIRGQVLEPAPTLALSLTSALAPALAPTPALSPTLASASELSPAKTSAPIPAPALALVPAPALAPIPALSTALAPAPALVPIPALSPVATPLSPALAPMPTLPPASARMRLLPRTLSLMRMLLLPLLTLLLALTLVAAAVFNAPALAAPTIYSPSYCLVDGDTCQPILSKNADQMRPIASTTKIMTGILALEYADMEEIATVSPYADRTAEYTIGLKAGQQLPLGELMKASLIKSSNDAAVVLAEHVAGDEALFAHLMSLKAFAIGAMRTHFSNASGLPEENAYSTAYDLAIMSRYALTLPLLAQLVALPQTEFKHPAYREPLTIRNTNGLINSYPGITGLKTGTADASGKCLVASATRNQRQLIAVVLKSGDRNGDCTRLLNYGFNHSQSIKVIDSQEVFKNAKIDKAATPLAEIMPAQDLWLWMGDSPPDIQKIVRMNYQLQAPLSRRDKVGELDIYVDGQYMQTIDLHPRENVSRETFWQKLGGGENGNIIRRIKAS